MRKSKTVLDSGFHAMDSSHCQWNLDSSIQIVRGIPDSLSCIPDSKAQGFRFHRPTFHALRRIRIPLHGVSWGLLSLSRQCHAKRGAGQGQLPADAKDKPIRVHLTVDLQLPCSPPPPPPPNPKPECWKSKLITATPVHPGKEMGRCAFDNAPPHWQLSLPRFPFWVAWQKERGPELVV